MVTSNRAPRGVGCRSDGEVSVRQEPIDVFGVDCQPVRRALERTHGAQLVGATGGMTAKPRTPQSLAGLDANERSSRSDPSRQARR